MLVGEELVDVDAVGLEDALAVEEAVQGGEAGVGDTDKKKYHVGAVARGQHDGYGYEDLDVSEGYGAYIAGKDGVAQVE